MSDLPEGWVVDEAGGFYWRMVKYDRATIWPKAWFVTYDHWHQRWCVTDSDPLVTRRGQPPRHLIEGAMFTTPEAAMTAANVHLAGGDT